MPYEHVIQRLGGNPTLSGDWDFRSSGTQAYLERTSNGFRMTTIFHFVF